MSRLESFIRRMSAQRDILDDLAGRLDAVPGPILEIGFGNGRTYDHLRQRFPGRRILVFESVVVPDLPFLPPPEDLLVGDVRDTARHLPDAGAALVHADIESGLADRDDGLGHWLPALVARLLAPGGFAASGCPLPHPRLAPHPLPPGVPAGRYFVARRLPGPG
ncbi:class I SAM-dependent methyltransferase [Lichenibacterium ramalinae]|uniref:S-adenosyl-L-methionine methyltransferase n=1 Tax=Lichenibacterium ramalinae TaxID=2316527 RepID=A0A4Q2R5S0_9HYPH|nr:class I SAM-dependent methyltransferase [Lichenibacterium ramalinae]RYB01702.1 hypothetical protein D3272_24925 [Lichenibacterium ramalinae]